MEDQNQEAQPSTESIAAQIKRNAPFTFGTGVSVALALIGGQLLAGVIGAIGVGATVGFDSDSAMMFVLGATLIIGFPLAVWIVLRRRDLAPTAWQWNSKFWVLIPISFLMTFCVSYTIGTLLELLPNYKDMMSQYADTFSSINTTLLLIGGGIIGPICEEIIFRGIILKGFLKTYDYKKAILFSAIIFGVIHMIPIQMVTAFFIGLVLGYIYYKTRSLWLVSIIHVINNLVAFSIGMEGLAEEESTREYFNNDLLFFGSLVLALVLIYVLYTLFERLHVTAETDDGIVRV